MGRSHDLTEIEKGKIDVLCRQNSSIRETTQEINRAKSCVGAYISTTRKAGAKKRPGMSKILFERGRRAVVRIAARGRMTARKVLAETKAPVSLHLARQHSLGVWASFAEAQNYIWTYSRAPALGSSTQVQDTRVLAQDHLER